MNEYMLDLPVFDLTTVKLLSPHLVLGFGMVLAMLLETLRPDEDDRPLIVSLGPILALVALASVWWCPVAPGGGEAFGGMILLDGLSRGAFSAVLIALFLVLLCADGELRRHKIRFVGEYYALLMAAALGMLFLAGTGSLIMVFLGLELLSLALYMLCVFFPDQNRSQEAGLKYFILSSAASSILLYGMAMVYGATGSTWLSAIAQALRQDPHQGNSLLLVGVALMAAGLTFKISAVPFHWWTPDVYEGAPTSTTAFMSVATKAAALVAIIRVFTGALTQVDEVWAGIFLVLGMLSVFMGNLMALVQDRVKRMLAYSAIAHAGYLLLGPLVGSERVLVATLFYLITYAFMNAGAFLALMAVEAAEGEPVTQDSIRGLASRSPLVAVCFAVCLVSLAGLPPTGGFLAKFYLFGAALPDQKLLVVAGVLGSLFGAYYYLGTVIRMFSPARATGDEPVNSPPAPLAAALVIAATGVLLTGLLAQPILDWLGSVKMMMF